MDTLFRPYRCPYLEVKELVVLVSFTLILLFDMSNNMNQELKNKIRLIMKNKTTNIIFLALIVASFLVGAFLFPQLPEKIVSHWDASGQPNGYMGKFWGIFLFPVIMLGMFVLYAVIPLIDPLKSNIQTFRKYYNTFWIFFEIFFVYIYGLTLIWNLGYSFNLITATIPAIAFLYIFIGSFLKNVKRNWFVGIRTPWTMSNDVVWDKTHKLGGKLFQASGVISLLGLFFRGNIGFFVIIMPVIISALIAVIYSYIVYKKIK